jgi:hypothetical protein
LIGRMVEAARAVGRIASRGKAGIVVRKQQVASAVNATTCN